MTIGVLDSGHPAGEIRDAFEDAGRDVRYGSAADLEEAAVATMVAFGDDDVRTLIRESPVDPAPMLLAAESQGLPSFTPEEIIESIPAIARGEYRERVQPVLGVSAGTATVGRVAFDVALLAPEPGEITEFGISSAEDLGHVRADGVVVATPAGSHRYARAAGGPRIESRSGAVVVPIAPFTLSRPRWVVDLEDDVEIANRRSDEVRVLLDGTADLLSTGPYQIERVGSFRVAVLGE